MLRLWANNHVVLVVTNLKSLVIGCHIFGARDTFVYLTVTISNFVSCNVTLDVVIMPKRSKVWLHFAQVDTNRARCSICQKVVLAKDGNTSNLAKHLIMHKINLRSDSCSVFDCKAKKAKKDDGTSVTRPPPSSTSNSLSASDRDSAGSLANNITGKVYYQLITLLLLVWAIFLLVREND